MGLIKKCGLCGQSLVRNSFAHVYLYINANHESKEVHLCQRCAPMVVDFEKVARACDGRES